MTQRSEHTSAVEGTYFINQELIEEMVRLNRQGRIITNGMGGVFPEQGNLLAVRDVLDAACGPGEWAIRAAREHPDIRVTGVDLSQRMIEYAGVQAQAEKVPATFREMNVLEPLDFDDATFDLVNIRMLVGLVPREIWTGLLRECSRILRPGGTIRVTESETSITSSLLMEQVTAMWSEAFKKAGYSFSVDGRHFGITVVLKQLLKQAGYVDPRHRTFAIDFSAGAEAHKDVCENFLLSFRLGEPLLLKTKTATAERNKECCDQLRSVDFASPDFCGYWHFMTVWARKP